SRRRHTRFSRDWSSDVCSSDLPILILPDRSLYILRFFGSRYIQDVPIRPVPASWWGMNILPLPGPLFPVRVPGPIPGPNLCHPRSEEHTSELQSRENLVCRLLL